MADDTSRSKLQRQLEDRRESIDRRIDVLEDEIVSAPAAIKSSLATHPIIGIAGAIAAGVAVGLIFGVRRKHKSDSVPFHQQLVEQYIDAVGDDVRRRTRRGKNAAEAVRDALRNRTPVIVYSPNVAEPDEDEMGFFGRLGDIALKTALGFVVKSAIDFFTASINVKELQKMLALEEQEERRATRSTTGDGAAGSVQEPTGFEESSP